MMPSMSRCEECTDFTRWGVLPALGIATALILPSTIIGGLVALSEQRGRGNPPKETLRVWLSALVVFTAITLINAQFMDVSLNPKRLEQIGSIGSGHSAALDVWLYLWIASVTAVAVGYQLPWRFTCILPVVFALVTIESQEPGLSASAPRRALFWAILVILPCSLLGVWLRRIADRRALGSSKAPPSVTATEHGPPVAEL